MINLFIYVWFSVYPGTVYIYLIILVCVYITGVHLYTEGVYVVFLSFPDGWNVECECMWNVNDVTIVWMVKMVNTFLLLMCWIALCSVGVACVRSTCIHLHRFFPYLLGRRYNMYFPQNCHNFWKIPLVNKFFNGFNHNFWHIKERRHSNT